MRITAMAGSDGSGLLAIGDVLERLTVQVTNTTGSPVSPHFATSTGATTSPYWKVSSGPAVLAAGRSARYVLLAPSGGVGGPGVNDRILLRAVAPSPMSLSTQLIGFGPSQGRVTALQRAAAAEEHEHNRNHDHSHDDHSAT
jgi:hypothetical protein